MNPVVKRSKWLLTLGVTAATIFGASALAQEAYPARPVRLVVGFGAGGPTDIPARHVAEKLGNLLGQRVIVENKTGAAGIIATRDVLAQPAGDHPQQAVADFVADIPMEPDHPTREVLAAVESSLPALAGKPGVGFRYAPAPAPSDVDSEGVWLQQGYVTVSPFTGLPATPTPTVGAALQPSLDAALTAAFANLVTALTGKAPMSEEAAFSAVAGLGIDTVEQVRAKAIPANVQALLSNDCTAAIDTTPAAGEQAMAIVHPQATHRVIKGRMAVVTVGGQERSDLLFKKINRPIFFLGDRHPCDADEPLWFPLECRRGSRCARARRGGRKRGGDRGSQARRGRKTRQMRT